jgi:phosphoribosyl-ATP pyrophosphohydrolase
MSEFTLNDLALRVKERAQASAEVSYTRTDLLYHLLVVLEARSIALPEVEAALAERLARSGLDEKASRRRE